MNEQLRKWLKDFRDKLIDGQIVKESDGDPWGYTKSEGDQIQAYLEANLPIALANPLSDKLRTLLGELYQVLGVLGAPANVLDQVSAGAAGKPLPHDTLLPFAAPDSAPPTNDQIKRMVNRFLCWRLPENFNPDGGISFKKIRNENSQYSQYLAKNEPVGTNLFDATQAEEMVRYMVEGLDSVPPDRLTTLLTGLRGLRSAVLLVTARCRSCGRSKHPSERYTQSIFNSLADELDAAIAASKEAPSLQVNKNGAQGFLEIARDITTRYDLHCEEIDDPDPVWLEEEIAAALAPRERKCWMKFRKKPVIIEATQWFKNGDHPKDDCRTITPVPGDGESFLSEGKIVRYFRRPDVDGDTPCRMCSKRMHIHGWIDTKEGGHIVCPGDWIITGVQGENYPCKPDIFVATYEEVA